MNITIINGSPKLKKSNSELLIHYLEKKLQGHNVNIYNISRKKQYEAALNVEACEALVLVFPLYDDGIPSTLLNFLITLEEQGVSEKLRIYACINNGFYEGRQNGIAVEQLKIWCEKTGAQWGQAIGGGAGEMLRFMHVLPFGVIVNWNLRRGIQELSENILSLSSGADFYFSPLFPRFLWKACASVFFWYPRGIFNGVKPWELSKRN